MMSVQKQSVSFTDTAFAFAKELVEAGEYPNVSAAVSGELVKAKAGRERERLVLSAVRCAHFGMMLSSRPCQTIRLAVFHWSTEGP